MSTPTAVPDHHQLLPGKASVSLRQRLAGGVTAGAALATLTGPWHLAVLDDPDRGPAMAVKDSAFLGRDEVLSNPLVSRHHPHLYLHGSRALTQNRGSANGFCHCWHLELWLRVRRETRMKEGTFLRLGDSVLELRRYPCDLVVTAPATQASSTTWLTVGSLVCVLVMGGSVVVALRTGSRDAMSMVMVVSMVTTTIMRLVPFL